MSRVFQASRSLMAATKSGSKSVSSSASSAKPAIKSFGIMKPQPVSPAMEKFVGVSTVSRAEVIKKIWDDIKLNQLQNPANKREILCDDKLKTILQGKEKIGMFEISKLISPHFVKS